MPKPHAEPGTICPLLRKDVAKVCHNCAWWGVVRVRTAANPSVEYDHWACAMNLHTILMRDVGAGVNGVQAATESFRNEVARRADVYSTATYPAATLSADGSTVLIGGARPR